MEKLENIEVYMERNIFDNSIGTYISKSTPEGFFHAKIEWVKVKDRFSMARPEPTFLAEGESSFNKDAPPSRFIKSLMSALDTIGLLKKQPEAKMLEGELKATALHLEDMRSMNKTFMDNAFHGEQNGR